MMMLAVTACAVAMSLMAECSMIDGDVTAAVMNDITFTAQYEEGPSFEWEYSENGDGTITITGVSPAVGDLSIPSSIDGKMVSGIGASAFGGCSGLTGVTIPSGVTSIGDSAFTWCSSLTSVTIPNSVTNIGAWALSYCSGLTGVTVPNSVTSIGEGAFFGCTGLADAHGFVIVTDTLFVYVGEMADVEIPVGVANIGAHAFRQYPISSVTIPASVTGIGVYAFEGCYLTNVTFEGNAPTTGDNAFDHEDPDCVVRVPSGSTGWGVDIPGTWQGMRIEYYGDAPAPTMHTVTFDLGSHGTRTGGGELAQSVAHGGTAVAPEVTPSTGWAFTGWNGDVTAAVTNDITFTAQYEEEPSFEWEYSENGDGTITVTGVSPAVGDVSIPSSIDGKIVTGIGDFSFYDCSELTSMTIPGSVRSIGYVAFYGCIGLTSLIIPEGLTHIGHAAFMDCSGIANVTIPDSVKYIGWGAFYGCNGLADADGFIIVNDTLFDYVGTLTDVEIPVGVASIGASAFSDGGELTSVTIPGSVTNIESGTFGAAFSSCSGLTNVTFLGNAPAVGDGVFYDVSSDCVVRVPYGSTGWGVEIPGTWNGIRIEYYGDAPAPTMHTVTFDIGAHGVRTGGGDLVQTVTNGCTAAAPIVAANEGWEFIGWDGDVTAAVTNDITFTAQYEEEPSCEWDYSENGDGTITITGVSPAVGDVSIPSSIDGKIVTGIGAYAFAGCSGLTSVTIPSGVTSIGNSAFTWCSSLTSVTIPSGVTSIGAWALSYCGLTGVTVPDSVTTIGDAAFFGCFELADNDGFVIVRNVMYGYRFDQETPEITIPNSVTNIGAYALAGSVGLTSITIPGSVTGIGDCAFYQCPDLTNMTMNGNAPAVVQGAFEVSESCVLYVRRGSTGWGVEIPGTWNGIRIEYADADNGGIVVVGDDNATVTGDAESGYIVTPSAGMTTVEVSMPEGVDAANVTVKVAATVETVKANGANVRVIGNGDNDITAYLDIPVRSDGALAVGAATVKEEIAKEPLDTTKGAEIDLGDSAKPSITTPVTHPGLTYTLREGRTLNSMSDGATKAGDGKPWTPNITIKGGTSGFYTIRVSK